MSVAAKAAEKIDVSLGVSTLVHGPRASSSFEMRCVLHLMFKANSQRKGTFCAENVCAENSYNRNSYNRKPIIYFSSRGLLGSHNRDP